MNLKPIKLTIPYLAIAYATAHATNQTVLPTIPKNQSSLEWALQQIPNELIAQLPTLVQSRRDVEGRNAIKEVYYTISPTNKELKIEYNVVFENEKYPVSILSQIHGFYHKMANGRKEDIETIVMYFDNNTLTAVGFPDTYSDRQEYAEKIPKHNTAMILAPVMDVYVNTWNHLFSEKDNNTYLEKYLWKLTNDGSKLVYKCANGLEAKMIPGDRETAEQKTTEEHKKAAQTKSKL